MYKSNLSGYCKDGWGTRKEGSDLSHFMMFSFPGLKCVFGTSRI